LIGITLQLGVLVYFGIAAQFPAVMYTLLKDDHVVARYALPCAVVGTVLLVASMLICAHVVEASTSEMRYRPVEGVEARVVWLQRSETVNDQAFDSFAIFPAHAQAVITTSRRASRRRLAVSWWPKQNEAGVTVIEVENVVAVVGALIGICGFIVQFVGLRSMHWSASAAQLGATIIMTVLRASVRRNLSKNPQSRPLLPGHEMDWLAMALGGPESVNDSWLSKSGRHWDWRVVAVEDPSRCEKLRPQSGIASREICESMSQRAALTRRDLGALADWYGPASPDAIALARAIEATLNAFDDLITRDAKELIWSLPALKPSDTPHREPIAFRVKRQQDGNWVTFADEIEAALSLWLYSVHERENPQSSVEGRREKEEDGRAPVVMPLQKRGDEWLRSKGSPAKRSLRLLGSYSQALQQDVRLWMPDGSVRVIGVGQNSKKFTDESKTIEMDRHRMVGHAFGWTDSDSPKESRIRLTKITLPDQDSAVDGTPINTILATESYSPLTTLFVHHMFTTFMWAIAKTIEKPIADSADIRITEVDEANGDLRRRSFALHTSRLSKLAQDIQSTGLGRLEDVYLCILPPLSIENKLPPTCKHTKDVNGRTPLHLVAVAGSEADVRRVVELGADKDARDDKNQTPLHVAIAKGNLAVARAVIDLGANIEARTLDGWTPLAAAARYGHAEIVVALAQRGADKEARNSDGWTPLAIAARYGHAVAAETIIRLGANKEAETSDGWTPLVLAARYGNTRVVETLIKLGVCADATTSRGWLPLFQAASEGEEGTTRMLIKHGANTEVKNLAGRTPLHGAASKGATAVVKALVELKADKEARDNFNGTPLHWAAAGGHTETVRALVRLGTDKNSRVSGGWISHYEAIVAGDQNMKSIAGEEEGSGGQTPMHLAAMNGHAAVIEALIELGADRNAKDRRGWTPRDWAERGAMRRLRTS
jgi:ankyrin repeat protein